MVICHHITIARIIKLEFTMQKNTHVESHSACVQMVGRYYLTCHLHSQQVLLVYVFLPYLRRSRLRVRLEGTS